MINLSLTYKKKKKKKFNKFFADQCQPLNNASDLSTNKLLLSQSRLGSLDFNEEELLQIIRALNINKDHGHDDIFIRMIKICDSSLLKPLIVLIKSSCYPDIWKKSNVIPVHKKWQTTGWKLTTNFSLTYLW